MLIPSHCGSFNGWGWQGVCRPLTSAVIDVLEYVRSVQRCRLLEEQQAADRIEQRIMRGAALAEIDGLLVEPLVVQHIGQTIAVRT